VLVGLPDVNVLGVDDDADGTPLVDDPGRIGEVSALGLDETLFCRTGRWRTQHWSTSIVDVSPGGAAQLLDLIPGKSAAKAHERLDERGEAKLLGLLAAGDPHGEVRMAWHAKEVVRSIYEIPDAQVADEFVAQLGHDLQDRSCPPEVNSLGRTLRRWHDEIVN
jgi:hypothetical protein